MLVSDVFRKSKIARDAQRIPPTLALTMRGILRFGSKSAQIAAVLRSKFFLFFFAPKVARDARRNPGRHPSMTVWRVLGASRAFFRQKRDFSENGPNGEKTCCVRASLVFFAKKTFFSFSGARKWTSQNEKGPKKKSTQFPKIAFIKKRRFRKCS